MNRYANVIITKTLINSISVGVGGSPLVAPASDLYNLRGPVKLSKVTYQLYDSIIGQSGKRYYDKGNNNPEPNDEIIIMY